MKFMRLLTAFLIMTLAISPALTANCAVACESKNVMSSLIAHSTSIVQPDDMSGMKNCHKKPGANDATGKHQSKSDINHQSCAMGTGCHFAHATPADSVPKYKFFVTSSISFPPFNPSANSADLFPPLKPPA